MSVGSARKNLILGLGRVVWLGLAVLLCSFPAWSQPPPMDQPAKIALADSHREHELPPVGSNTLSTKWEVSAARLLINPEPALLEQW